MAGIDSVKFRGRHNSLKALIALITGGIAVIGLIVMIIISGFNNAESTVLMGALAIAAFLICVIGFFAAAAGSRERDIFPAVPLAAMIVNGAGSLFYLLLYVIGLF